MTSSVPEIRTMTREEVDLAVEWAAGEGWNPGLRDADAFYAADPDGFLIETQDGEPIATISATRYEGGFAFMGFYIVKPELRGRGYGLRIWQAAVDRLKGYNVGLDGVLEQQANYERSGFKLAYRNVRYEGIASAAAPRAQGIAEANTLPFEQILAYDTAHFSVSRPGFLQAWLQAEGSTALAHTSDDGSISGYGVVRPCRSGFKIGPLFAQDASIAEALFEALSGSVPAGETIYLDTPQVNPEAVRLAESHEMKPGFETVRMYTGAAPQLPFANIFGVTSFELG